MSIEQIPGTLKYFVNALPASPTSCYAVLITATNNKGNEASIDALIEQDNFCTWLRVVKEVLGKGWTVYEAIPIAKNA